MKLKKSITLSVFAIAFALGTFKSLTALATDEARKLIEPTICCNNGVYTGDSNNCVTGEGSCVVHNCLPGETKVPGPFCYPN
jgi:hypothetical protein